RNGHRLLAANSLERTLGQMEAPADALAAVQALVAEEAEFPSWAVGMRGERAFLHQGIVALRERKARWSQIRRMLATPRKPSSGPIDEARDWLRDRFPAHLRADEAWLLRLTTAILADAGRPMNEQAPLVEQRLATLSSAPEFARELWPPFGLFKPYRLLQLGQA